MPIGNVQPFEVRVERLDDAVVLEFVGELDLTVGEDAATALADAVCDIPRMIVVNLQGLSFMDSTGLHCLVRAKSLADAVGTRLAIMNGSGPAHRLLSSTGIDELIETVDDLTQLDPPAVGVPSRVQIPEPPPPWTSPGGGSGRVQRGGVRLTDSSRPDAGQDGRQQISKPAWQITKAERVDRTTVALALAGDFDVAAYEPVGELLQALERHGARLVVIDLEHVTFIGIVGIRFLVEAQERADLGGWALVIVAPRDPRHGLLALADLDDQLNITHGLRRSRRSERPALSP